MVTDDKQVELEKMFADLYASRSMVVAAGDLEEEQAELYRRLEGLGLELSRDGLSEEQVKIAQKYYLDKFVKGELILDELEETN